MEEKERIKLELEKNEIKKQEEEFQKKEKELADKERLAPWNVDTIGKEAWSKTVVNKPVEKKDVAKPKLDDEEENKRMVSFDSMLWITNFFPFTFRWITSTIMIPSSNNLAHYPDLQRLKNFFLIIPSLQVNSQPAG